MYAAQRTKARGEALAFRSYVADSLQSAPQGKYLSHRWADLIAPHEDIDVEAIVDKVVSALSS